MSDPQWLTPPYEGIGFTFPNVSTFVTADDQGTSQINGPPIPTTGTYYFELQCLVDDGYGICAGLVESNYTGGNARENVGTAGTAWVSEGGYVYVDGAFSVVLQTGMSTGCVIRVLVSSAGIAFAIGTGLWQNAYTDAQVGAGTGLVSASGMTTPLQPMISLSNADGHSWALAASSGSCTYGLPAGASYLPATPDLTISSVSGAVGAPVSISWSSSTVAVTAGLDCSLDNGNTWTTCTAGDTGMSGVATGPDLPDDFVLVLIRQTGDPTSASPVTPYAPSGVEMSIPLWTLPGYESTFTETTPGTFVAATTQAESQINGCGVPQDQTVYFEFQCINFYSNCVAGLIECSYTGPNLRDNVGNTGSAWIAENYNVYVNGNHILNLAGPGVVTGDTIRMISSPSGIAFAKNGGPWNGQYTDSQICTSSGMISISSLTAPLCIVMSLEECDSDSWAIAASPSQCKYAPPPGSVYLPGNAQLTITSVTSQVGQPTQIAWSATNGTVTGLNYSLNGGAWIACTGGVDGSNGVALGPTLETNGLNQIAIQNAAQAYGVGATAYFEATYLTGEELVSTTGTLNGGGGGGPPRPTISGTFAPQSSITFQIDITEVIMTGFGTQWSGEGCITDGTTGGIFIFSLSSISETLGSFALVPAIGTSPPTSGPTTISVLGGTTQGSLLPISVYGTITVTSMDESGSVFGNASLVSSAGTSYWENVIIAESASSENVIAGWQFTSSVGLIDYGVLVYGTSSESIDLTLASCTVSGDSLELGGATIGGPATSMDYSTDAGDSWSSTIDYQSSAGTGGGALPWTAGGGILDAGTYEVRVRDSDTLVESNILQLVVNSTAETITLASAQGSFGTALQLAGTSDYGPPAGLNYSLDNGVTFAATTNYTSQSGTAGPAWSALGTNSLAAGTYQVQVQDSVTAVRSNVVELIVAGEVIVLSSATPIDGGALALAGTTSNGPPSAMDVTLDGEETWAPTLFYTSASGTASAPWTANSPVVPGGTLTIRVRDHNQPSVISNALTLTIGGFDTWDPIQAPSQPGTSAKPKAKLLTSGLGDGYVGRCEDGINFNVRSQTCNWASISVANWKTITDFFDAHVGVPFYYAFPGDVGGLRKWTVTAYNTGNWNNGGNGGFYTDCTLTLKEDFTVDPAAAATTPTPPAPFVTWTPPVSPAADGSGLQVQARMNASTFGDGYVEQVLDGLNPIGRTQQLQWDMVDQADWTAIEEFLYPRLNGVPFYYAMPNDPAGTRLWTVADLKIGTWNGEFYTANTATLQIDYSIDPAST